MNETERPDRAIQIKTSHTVYIIEEMLKDWWKGTELNTCRLLPNPVCGGMVSGGCFILGGSVGGRG